MLELRGIERRYDGESVLGGIDLDVAKGELLALIGPSGCGKSTLLRIVAGLDRPDAGSIRFAGRDLDRLPPAERRVAMTFDDGALYDHLNVADNLLVGLDRFGLRGAAARAAAAEAAATVGVNELLGRRPPTLSAGQRRRVALARAIARRPDILLLDEPLTHLDLAARLDLREDLRRAHRSSGAATILVTHDHADAVAVADRVAFLGRGKILHVGAASTFHRPLHVDVARGCSWTGLQVVAATTGEGGWIALPSDAISVTSDAAAGDDPDDFMGEIHHLAGPAGPIERTDGTLAGVVVTISRAAVGSAEPDRLRWPLPPGRALALGDRLRIRFEPGRIQRFDRSGQRVAE